MKKLLLLLILSFLSSNSLAKVGDVYYCEMKFFTIMFDDNVKESWTRIGEKFKFKREKNKLLMRDSKFFGNMEMTVTSQYKDEVFKATYPGLGMYIQYSDGKFGLSDVGAGMISSFIADCEIW